MKLNISYIILAVSTQFALLEVTKSEIFSQVNFTEDFRASEFKKLVWSEETNGVSVGLIPSNPKNNSIVVKKETIEIVLTNNTANQLAFILPEMPFRFSLAVFDEKGTPVNKTESGHNIGKPLPGIENSYAVEWSGHKYDKTRTREFLSAHSIDFFASVNLLDYFKIEKPGKYRVEYEQRFQIATLQSNKVSWVGFTCPKAVTTIEVH